MKRDLKPMTVDDTFSQKTPINVSDLFIRAIACNRELADEQSNDERELVAIFWLAASLSEFLTDTSLFS